MEELYRLLLPLAGKVNTRELSKFLANDVHVGNMTQSDAVFLLLAVMRAKREEANNAPHLRLVR